jgi:hypothetical protein
MTTGTPTRRGMPRWLIIVFALLVVGACIVLFWVLFSSGVLPPQRSAAPQPTAASVEQTVQEQLAAQVVDLQQKYDQLQAENADLKGQLEAAQVSGTPEAVAGVGAEGAVADSGAVREPFDWSGLPDCPYVDTGSPQPLNKDGSIPIREVEGGLWEADLSQNGCALIFEGRIIPDEPLHRVIVLRSYNGEHPEFVEDGKLFTYAEGSIWGYDRTWNMEDFSTSKASIAGEYVDDKAAVMKAENSFEPIKAYLTNGQVMEFAPGETWAGVVPNDACEFEEPLFIPVHGEILSGRNGFSAAIGAIGCTTVAWIDGNMQPEIWTGQRDGERKVQFASIEAWMMPSSWDQAQIQEWINNHK